MAGGGVSKREAVGEKLGCDASEWVSERRRGGSTWPEIAEEVRRLTGIKVSDISVRNWATENRDAARARARASVQRYRRRYGNDYDSKGRSRAITRALAMFREEHPDVWQRLLDEECGEFRASSA